MKILVCITDRPPRSFEELTRSFEILTMWDKEKCWKIHKYDEEKCWNIHNFEVFFCQHTFYA